MQDVPAEGNTNCAADHKKDFKLITGLCPVQKVKVMDSGGTLVEMLAMIDSGSNTSLLSKNAAERLGIALFNDESPEDQSRSEKRRPRILLKISRDRVEKSHHKINLPEYYHHLEQTSSDKHVLLLFLLI